MDTRTTELLDKVAQMNRQLGRLATQENTANLNVGTSSGAWATAYRIFNINNSAGPNAFFGASGTDTTLERAYISIDAGTDAPGQNATESISLLANGNVGIGSILPTHRLEVAGTFNVTSSLAAGGYIAGIVGVAGASRDILLVGQSGYSNGFTVQYIDGVGMRYILQNGKVGVNATPLLPLHVNGNYADPATSGATPNGILAITNNDTYASLYAGASSNAGAGYPMWLQAAGRNDLSVEYPLAINPHGGYVGIGTLNPQHYLHVYSGALQFGVRDYRISLATDTAGGWARAWTLENNYAGANGIAIFGAYGTSAGASRAYLTIADKTTDETGYAQSLGIHLLSNGNVGIGIADPLHSLEVYGQSSEIALSKSVDGGVTRLLFRNRAASPTKRNWHISTQYNVDDALEITPSTAAGGSTYSTPSMIFLPSGYVGVGVSPGYPLDVNGATLARDTVILDGQAQHLRFRKTNLTDSADDLGIFAGTGDNTWYLADWATKTKGMVIDTGSGYVGIGAMAPERNLHIYSGGDATETVLGQSTANGYPHFYTYFNRAMGTGGTAVLQVVNWGYAYGSLALQPAGGGVGIGTSSPGALLHIKGASPYLLMESGSANQDNGLYLWDTSNLKGRLMYQGTASASWKWFGLYNDGADYLGMYSDTYRMYDLAGTNLYIWNFLSSGTPQVSILNNAVRVNGTNVIIGGSTAIHKLTVNGNLGPGTDNANSCGTSGTRWTAIYAVNGTIQTSDARMKTDVVDSPLGLDFIMKLRPVAYRWKVGGKRKVGDGESDYTDIPGKRMHYGMLAQDVRAVLPAGVDFGGWILDDVDDPDSQQSLAYHEFIGPLVRAVQELSVKVVNLERALALKEM